MLKFMIGALAVAWGVVVAVLDRPGASTGRHTNRLCTALLVASAAVALTGGAAAAMRHW